MSVSFDLGRVVATPAALAALEKAGDSYLRFLARHTAGDWGDLGELDQAANAEALVNGNRLMSAYALSDGTKLWIITEGADDQGCRHNTCVLLPEDY